jgi:hypothetical protein
MRRSVRIEYDAMPEATTGKGSQQEISAINAETRTAAAKEQNSTTRSWLASRRERERNQNQKLDNRGNKEKIILNTINQRISPPTTSSMLTSKT